MISVCVGLMILFYFINVYAPLEKKISQSKSCKFCDKRTSKNYFVKNKTKKYIPSTTY